MNGSNISDMVILTASNFAISMMKDVLRLDTQAEEDKYMGLMKDLIDDLFNSLRIDGYDSQAVKIVEDFRAANG